jgi:hypothetical protein
VEGDGEEGDSDVDDDDGEDEEDEDEDDAETGPFARIMTNTPSSFSTRSERALPSSRYNAYTPINP